MVDVEAAMALEHLMSGLRADIRGAVIAGDQARADTLQADLDRADSDWKRILELLQAQGTGQAAVLPTAVKGSLLTLREQAHEALLLLQVPAPPKLIATVHEAFFGSTFPAKGVTSLKRDEVRSFRRAPFSRPYYICPALSFDSLAPSRGLLAISDWELPQRIIGPDSPRADFLSAAINLATAYEDLPRDSPAAAAALQLLARFAADIPGSRQGAGPVSPQDVILAAQAQREAIGERDSRARAEAATWAGEQQLDATEQIFGKPPRPSPVDTGFPAQLAPSAPADRAARRPQQHEPAVLHHWL
jgi:hypothetical protein